MEPKLNEFIPKSQFHRTLGHIVHVEREIPLPTEVVVWAPQVVAPKVARVYWTSFQAHEGRIVPENTHGIPPNPVVLMEVWSNNGDDGHVDFVLRGWRFVTREALEEADRLPIPHSRSWPAILDFLGRQPEDGPEFYDCE